MNDRESIRGPRIFNASFKLIILAALVFGGSASLSAQESFPSINAADSEWLRVRTDYLFWWTSGNHLPPLVTTSPNGTPRNQAGVLGALGTQTLFGNGPVDNGTRPGGRAIVTGWLDDDQTTGVEGSFFFAGDDPHSGGYTNQSPGTPILSRPFLNAVSGLQDAELVAYPSVLAGTVTVSGFSEASSASLSLRQNARSGPYGRLDLLGGYRFFRFHDATAIREQLTSTNPGGLVPLGTTTDLTDRFDTANNFNGAELGFAVELNRDMFLFEFQSKVAFGNMQQSTTINGQTITTIPGLLPTVSPGGLLALPTNMGVHKENRFAALSEFGLKGGIRLTPQLTLTSGYTLILVSDVSRTGRHIDTTVNPTQIAGGALVGAPFPQYSSQQSLLWMQGISFGLDYSW